MKFSLRARVALFLCLLFIACIYTCGCGSFRGAAAGTKDLHPNYLDEVFVATRPGTTNLTYRMVGGLSFQRQKAQEGIDLLNRATKPEGLVIGRDDVNGLVPVEFTSVDFVGGGNLGRSLVEVGTDGSIVSARILLLNNVIISPTRLQAVASHEAIHGLMGVLGHPKKRPTIMSPTVPLIDFLYTLDVNTCRAIARHNVTGIPLPEQATGKGRKLANGNTLYVHVTRGNVETGELECQME